MNATLENEMEAVVASAAPPATRTLSLRASDASHQKTLSFRVPVTDTETTVGELIESLLVPMGLAASADGRPLTYSARLNREGRHLRGSERVAEALRENDELEISPSINAG